MKIKTSVLRGAALNYAVAKCEGATSFFDSKYGTILRFDGNDIPLYYYQPSTDPARAHTIIERERIAFDYRLNECVATAESWDNFYAGPTILIAAMRCYVASKMGDEVEIPDELA